ncbi:ornithine--oxo-acid transaminase [Mesoterricola silvestris]|uniref:ornithine aminotransferase n=1 Tax=Mesoterricola silvestris TaxID=2927979 RepID=A0AA48GM55_9BACT|nr:ornithine--oxo-acid transaminase [Mesoterricola silvestris]BDU73839.1 ornithine aminotransferase [Mesoterricola silvestris]
MKVDPGFGRQLMEQEERYGIPDPRGLEQVFLRADGVYLWDLQGNRFMDFLGGDGAVSQGHNHTRIAASMVEQCLRLSLVTQGVRHARLPPYLEKLCTLTGFGAALPMNTGAEAVEVAIKAARRWAYRVKGVAPGRAEILVFTGNAHGQTTTLAGLSGDPDAADDFGPFGAGFRMAAFGDAVAAAEAVGPATCAILVEPIQGRAGLRIPPRGFLRSLRELCDRRGLLLLADEVQCGLGRTGKLFAFEHEGIRPDGAILGKALSGGFYPASAFLASREIMDLLTPGSHRSTFAGNPLACAVASAALDVLAEEHLVDRSAELGAYFLARLRSMECPRVREARGLGLWAALELREPAARAACEALAREGLLAQALGDSILALTPPLIITREQLDWSLERLERVLAH